MAAHLVGRSPMSAARVARVLGAIPKPIFRLAYWLTDKQPLRDLRFMLPSTRFGKGRVGMLAGVPTILLPERLASNRHIFHG